MLAMAYQWFKINQFEENYPYPGKLVDVGGYSLHLNCTGRGAQTVILEAGSGMWSMDWYVVQKNISQFSKVCSYDRAGHGWSDFGDEPRTINHIVDELHTLLAAAEIDHPYVMVGASFGGSIVQLYELAYPAEVSGLVLVDARPKGFSEELRKVSPNEVSALTEGRAFVSGLYDIGLVTAIIGLQGPFEFKEQPPHLHEVYAHLGRLTKHTAAHAKELAVDPISDQQMQSIGSLIDKPLVVIVHGQKTMFKDQLGLSDKEAEQMEQTWLDLQNQLLELSTNSTHLVAKESGHLVHQDQPDIIVEAVRELILSNSE